MTLAAQFSETYGWRTSKAVSDASARFVALLEGRKARVDRRDDGRLDAKLGRLRDALFRGPEHWPMTVSIELTPTDDGTTVTATFRDATPTGTRRGTEAAYRRGFKTLAMLLRDCVDGL